MGVTKNLDKKEGNGRKIKRRKKRYTKRAKDCRIFNGKRYKTCRSCLKELNKDDKYVKCSTCNCHNCFKCWDDDKIMEEKRFSDWIYIGQIKTKDEGFVKKWICICCTKGAAKRYFRLMKSYKKNPDDVNNLVKEFSEKKIDCGKDGYF